MTATHTANGIANTPGQLIQYHEEITAFLKSDKQKVLLIHGLWGTGKTYFWKRVIRERQSAIKERFYSYVSLFGATSLADVKSLTLFSAIQLFSAKGAADEWEQVKPVLARINKWIGTRNLPVVGNIGSLLPTFEELLIKNYLVCLDDLERRNRALDLEQLFGLVSVFKEQNNCRVVIICNETELSRRDRRTLDKYREKIVDRQIKYAPSFEANFQVTFPESEGNEAARDVFGALRLNNIRVFQQARWTVEYFQPHFRNCHPSFVRRFKEQCIKLAAIHYALGKHLTFEQVQSIHWLSGLAGDDDHLPPESMRLLEQLRFAVSEVDPFIIAYLKDGYCDTIALANVIAKLNAQFEKDMALEELQKVWSLIYDGFRADTLQVIEVASRCLKQHAAHLPFASVKHLGDLMVEFEPSVERSFLVDANNASALGTIKSSDELTDLKFIEDNTDSAEVKVAAEQKRAELKGQRPINELIVSLADHEMWDVGYFALLNEYSDDAIAEWLATADEYRLLAVVARVMARAIGSPDGEAVATKLVRALTKLAKRSALDKFRVEKSIVRVLKQRLSERGIDAKIFPWPLVADSN